MKKTANKLDWNRMLGFEQITDLRQSKADALAPKVGTKVGNKLGAKQGIKA